MSLLGAHFQKLAALLQNLFFPSREFARAVCSDRHCALLRGLLSLLDGPRSILHPTEHAFDQTPIPGRPKRPSQMTMAVGALLVPVLIIGHCLRPLLADGLQSLDRNVQISRTVPSWAFSHFNSSLIRVRSGSSTIGEKNNMAVRRRVSAMRI